MGYIDLHCHTKKVKESETKNRNIKPQLFIKKMKEQNISIVAITNHNHFDKNQYDSFCETAKQEYNYLQIWPGVELDISFSDDKSFKHMIVVYNPKKIDKFIIHLNTILDSKYKNNLDFIINTFEQDDQDDCFYFVHYTGKKNKFSSDHLKQLQNILSDKDYKILKEEDSANRIKSIDTLTGSDIADWRKYNNNNISELLFEIPDFQSFMTLLKNKIQIAKNGSLPIHEYICGDFGTINDCFILNNLNVIFGSRGSGKTHMINTIIQQLQNEGKIVIQNDKFYKYEGSSAINDFDNLLEIKDEHKEKLKRNFIRDDLDYNEKIKKIVNWNRPTVSSPKSFKTSVDKEYSGPLSIVSVKRLDTSQTNNENNKLSTLLNNINKFEEQLDSFNEFSDILNNIRLELKSTKNIINQKIKKLLYKIIIDTYTNNSISNLSKIIEEESHQQISIESKFKNFAKEYINFVYECSTFYNNILNKDIYCEHKVLGEIYEKGQVDIKYTCGIDITGHKEESENSYKNKMTAIQKIFNSLEKISNINKNNKISTLVKKVQNEMTNPKLKEANYSIDYFLYYNSETVIKNKKYKLSDGEKTIMLLERFLSDDKDLYILDEPERSLSNNYIYNDLVQKILHLKDKNKPIIIATHDANIAVNTKPYNTIYVEYDGTKETIEDRYKSYIGNMYTNILYGKNDIKEWDKQSLEILEGGQNAFSERQNAFSNKINGYNHKYNQ